MGKKKKEKPKEGAKTRSALLSRTLSSVNQPLLMGARFTRTAVLQREGKRGGRDIVCNLICNVSMNIHAASITRSLYSSHTKLRLAQRGRSFLPSGGVSLPPTLPPPLVSPRSLSHGEAPHGNNANDLTRRRNHGAKQSGTS